MAGGWWLVAGGWWLVASGWCGRVRRSTFTAGAIMERAEYNRHSRARMAETAKDGSRHRRRPEHIDPRRRRTRYDHRTCYRGSRGSAERVPTVSHVAKTRRNVIFQSSRDARSLTTSHQPPATATSHQPLATSHYGRYLARATAACHPWYSSARRDSVILGSNRSNCRGNAAI